MKRIPPRVEGMVRKRSSMHGPESATTNDETIPEIRAKLARKPKAPPLVTKEGVNLSASEIPVDAVSAVMRAMGRRGERKGGKPRAATLTPARRKAIAKKAAARWSGRKKRA